MKCEDYFVLLSAHLDGMNEDTEEQKLQAHLDRCEACRKLLAQMQENDAALSESKMPPADLTKRIMQKVRKEPNKRKKAYWNIAVSGLATAAVLALVLFGGLKLPAQEKKELAEAAQETVAFEAPCEAAGSAPVARVATEEKAIATFAVESESLQAQASPLEDEDVLFYDSTHSLASATISEPTVLFLFASEVEELAEKSPLEFEFKILPADVLARYDALAPKSIEAYRVSYLTLHRLKEQYPSEYFEGSMDECIVFVMNIE